MLEQLLEQSQPLNCVQTGLRQLSLTFDDGPHEFNTPKLLDTLDKANFKATFFVTGDNARACPEHIREMVRRGHEVANHSITHANLDELESIDDIRREIVGTQEILREIIGVEPVLFRAPCGRHDGRVWQVLRELSLPSVMLNVSTSDWDTKLATVEYIYSTATENAQPGDIVVMHEWPENTPVALPKIVDTLQKKELVSVTVSQLLAGADKVNP